MIKTGIANDVNILVQEEMLKVKNRPYRDFDYKAAGMVNHTFIARQVATTTITIRTVIWWLFFNELESIQTHKISFKMSMDKDRKTISIEDVNALSLAVKQALNDFRLNRGKTWKEISIEIGYYAESGVLSRSMNSRSSAPVGMIWKIMDFLSVEQFTAKFEDISLQIIRVK
jgi:hypothetical protein